MPHRIGSIATEDGQPPAPSLVATYKYFPFGEPAMAVGDPGALIVELATLLTFPEATANAPIVPLLAFET